MAVGSVLAAWVALLAAQPAPQAGPTGAAQSFQPVDYTRDIEPVLRQHCYECHGSTRARARLRLHAPDLILKGGSHGPVVLPGKSGESELIRRILSDDPDDRMPLDADPLPAATVALLRQWVDQGAPLPPVAATVATPIQEHWAYVAPERPELPAVRTAGWARTPIDRFVLARLERETLAPSREADKSTLLRRVTLDLTGLPPAPEEHDAFLADAAPDAYEKVVDRLLASPRYGERWARPWLDLARYADTNGYEKDKRREIWKFRDWVIDALNRDMPFDQFTIEQIAGDMLPDATIDQKIASGFHRNAMTNEEGGVDPEEAMYEVFVDRVNTTSTVWLGTTLGCAQCHNHKYDPLSQKDYYRMLAFFANADYETRPAGDGTRYAEARLDLATPDQEQARTRLQAEIDRLDREFKAVTPEVRDALARWEQSMREAERQWTAVTPQTAAATNGVALNLLPDGSVLASGANPALTSYAITAETPLQGITGLRIETLPDPSLPKGGPGRDGYGHFRVTGVQVEIAPAVATGAQPPQNVTFRTIRANDSAYTFDPDDLLGAGDGPRDRKSGSWAINAMRETDRLARHAVIAAEKPFGFPEGTRLTVRIHHLDGTIGQGIGRLRLAVTTAPDPLTGVDVPARLRPILEIPADQRSQAQTNEVLTFFRPIAPVLKPLRDALAAARRPLADLKIPSTLVMKERASFERPSYEIRERGSFVARGERVYAATPPALHPMRDDQPMNRLGLARWLVDERNPLVARVTVNRLWEQLFGRGIVETSEDFGTQGSPPSHPELLDWMATEFMAKGWSQKALLRLIVTSAAYRQSSVVAQPLLDRDPDNRLLARGPRFRMEAEMLRDVALAASGLLSAKMHGPSVFPLQPPGIWNMPFSSDKWTTSDGEDRYRRSLYSFWRRTSPYPSFMTFDATSREFCTVRRVRTNTPLQALTLLNDPAAFEAARALARRMVAAGADDRARAAAGVLLVLSRAGRPAELDRLIALYRTERGGYARRPAEAARVLASAAGPVTEMADLAAWTMVANVLLNLDEAVTKN